MPMFSFFSRKPKNQPVPNWANFFSHDEYDTFIGAVETYFEGQGHPFTIDDGIVRTQWVSRDSSMQNLGLMNVAQMCKQGKVEDYMDIVENHFEVMRKSQDFMTEFFARMDDYDFVAPFIGTRLYHIDHVSSVGAANVLSKPVTEEIIALLVFDMPQAISSVKPEQAKVWGKSVDELIAIGLENIAENYPFDVLELEANIPIKAVVQDHFFGANILLDLANHPELVGTHGTLVGVPHRHTTLMFPIEDISVLRAINMMIPMINGMHNEGPGSISECLYWYRAGAFEKLPYTITDEHTVEFLPPSDLVALLEYLSIED
jgi:hypothetical protein